MCSPLVHNIFTCVFTSGSQYVHYFFILCPIHACNWSQHHKYHVFQTEISFPLFFGYSRSRYTHWMFKSVELDLITIESFYPLEMDLSLLCFRWQQSPIVKCRFPFHINLIYKQFKHQYQAKRPDFWIHVKITWAPPLITRVTNLTQARPKGSACYSAPLLFGLAAGLDTRPRSHIGNWRPMVAPN